MALSDYLQLAALALIVLGITVLATVFLGVGAAIGAALLAAGAATFYVGQQLDPHDRNSGDVY